VSGDVNDVILLASGDIERHTSMGLFPLNIYHQVPGYPTNYPIGYLGNKLPECGSPNNILSCPPCLMWDGIVRVVLILWLCMKLRCD